jgi:hypothetical protein
VARPQRRERTAHRFQLSSGSCPTIRSTNRFLHPLTGVRLLQTIQNALVDRAKCIYATSQICFPVTIDRLSRARSFPYL